MTNDSPHVVGIDLGTTFSSVAHLDQQGNLVTIRNSEGKLTTSSVVLFKTEENIVVGRSAQHSSVSRPESVAVCVKREMGEKYCGAPIAGKKRSPVYISSLILKKLKQDTERQLGGPIAGAVITVPAYFDDLRRQATIDAAKLAGLNVLEIINEPTAAALAFGFNSFIRNNSSASDMIKATTSLDHCTALVYDLGGGTFDVTVIKIEGEIFKVLATGGEVRLGGKDWDAHIEDYAARLFVSKFGEDPRDDPHSHQELAKIAVEVKEDLSEVKSTEFTIHHEGNRLPVEITREKFEELTAGKLYRTECRLDEVIKDAKLTWDQVDHVLVVGGSTRMPQVSNMLYRVTGREPDNSLSADEVIAHGAAIKAAMVAMKSPVAIPASETTVQTKEPTCDKDDGEEMIAPPKDSSRKTATTTTDSKNNETDRLGASQEYYTTEDFNFKESVSRTLSRINTQDVNSHSLGVIIQSASHKKERTSFLIPRNTPLPASNSITYGTVRDNQAMVMVKVVEGESQNPAACTIIGKCVVAPLQPNLPKGSPVSVTFSCDTNGQLQVHAKHNASNAAAKTVIHRQGAMSQTEFHQTAQATTNATVS